MPDKSYQHSIRAHGGCDELWGNSVTWRGRSPPHSPGVFISKPVSRVWELFCLLTYPTPPTSHRGCRVPLDLQTEIRVIQVHHPWGFISGLEGYAAGAGLQVGRSFPNGFGVWALLPLGPGTSPASGLKLPSRSHVPTHPDPLGATSESTLRLPLTNRGCHRSVGEAGWHATAGKSVTRTGIFPHTHLRVLISYPAHSGRPSAC